MEVRSCPKYYIHNVEDGHIVTIEGEGEFTIGLTLNETVVCTSPHNQVSPGSGNACEKEEDLEDTTIVVPLIVLTVWKTSGVTVAPASRDLPCCLNGEEVIMEANFIPGNQVEVGDKQLELLEEEPPPRSSQSLFSGTASTNGTTSQRPTALSYSLAKFLSSTDKTAGDCELRTTSTSRSSSSATSSRTPTPSSSGGGQTPRRQLPPTPGVPILPIAPRKPRRLQTGQITANSVENDGSAPHSVNDVGREALREWCLSQLPNTEEELIQQTRDPEQLASLTGSYVGRHINLYTGMAMTTDLTDRIFSVMLEVAQHRGDILRQFLLDVIEEFNPLSDGERESHDSPFRTSPSVGNISHHAQLMALLIEILKQFLDPQFLVVLCLQLLRGLSHIPGSVITLVESHTSTAVLGSMGAYREDPSVQSLCLDILAKVATYVPLVMEKLPLKESSIDLVMMALKLHYKKLPIAQGGIRTLANLASSLHSLSFTAMKGCPDSDLIEYVSLVIQVMDYLYSSTSDMVRQCLGHFSEDLTVKMDGRRFLFESTKMEQLKCQQKLWETQVLDEEKEETLGKSGDRSETKDGKLDNHCNDYPNAENGREHHNGDDIEDGQSSGILKKTRSYENLRTPDRRVSFVYTDEIPLHCSGSSSSSSSGENSPAKRSESPDIQVLSRNVIVPAQLSVGGDSTDGELGTPGEHAHSSSGGSTPSISSIVVPGLGLAPPKPPRRPIGAPLLHINSQSTDTDDTEGPQESSSPPPIPDRDYNNSTSSYMHKSENYDTHSSESLQELSNQNHGGVKSSDDNTGGSTTAILPVDLTGLRYSAADIVFMKKLLCVQVVCQVCAASANGKSPHSLKLLDMPLKSLLTQLNCPTCLSQFVRSQYTQDTTLMDIDPATVISLIDAVRYQVLVFDLVQGSLEMLVQLLSPQLHTLMFASAVEVVMCVRQNVSLTKAFQDQDFLQRVRAMAVQKQEKVKDRLQVMSLMDSLCQAFCQGQENTSAVVS